MAMPNEGAPTILVNNAGITRDNLLMRMKAGRMGRRDRDEPDRAVPVSARACLRRHDEGASHGRIVNISSVIAVMGNAGQANYAATKAGTVGFSKSLAREIASRGITVNVVAPGFHRHGT